MCRVISFGKCHEKYNKKLTKYMKYTLDRWMQQQSKNKKYKKIIINKSTL